jgi:triosephosphate isomerase
VQKELKKNKIPTGAQNAYHVDKGGYTGEVSAQMFKQAGATYALVGHAERRHVFHETNHDVRAKLEAVLAAKLVPVICVGETLEQRNENKTDEVIELQLRSALTDLTWPIKVPLIVAYEPVWAIGTGESCDAIAADAVAKKIEVFCKAIAKEAAVSVLYGGSVKPETAQSYFETGIFSGVLVGGASTKFETFAGIVKKVNS